MTNTDQIGLAVHHIGAYSHAKIVPYQTVQVQLNHKREHLFTLLYSLYLFNPGLDRGQSLLVTTGCIQNKIIQVSYLLGICTLLIL